MSYHPVVGVYNEQTVFTVKKGVSCLWHYVSDTETHFWRSRENGITFHYNYAQGHLSRVHVIWPINGVK